MHFGNPTAFWLLALVPALIAFLVWAFRARRRALERFAAPPMADKLAGSVHRVARRWKAVLLVGAVLFAVLALTQPRWGFEWREVKRRGVDIFVLLDVSRSMLTEDVKPNRLGQAKFAVKDLLAKLDGDRVGLIAFAGTAFVQCPLTVDYDAFKLTLDDADPRVIPRGGSTMAVAIGTALKGFDAGEGRDRAIVLISDGADPDEAADANAAAEEAKKQGVRIYSIGVGTIEGDLIPIRVGNNPLEFVKDKEGKVVKSSLNEETLREIAVKTAGIYFRSAAGDFGLDAIYDKGIRQLRREESEARLQKMYFERFQWPLGLAMLLLVIEMFVADRRRNETERRRNAETKKTGANVECRTSNVERRTAATAATLCVLLVAGAGAESASQLYEQGKFEEAFAQYRKMAEREDAKENWPLFYDLGVAAYKAGKGNDAAQAFERALSSPDPSLQQKSHYNLGNVFYRVGQSVEPQNLAGALPIYERSLKSYESALALDPNDADAKHNREVAQKKIEEVKKKLEEQKGPEGESGESGQGQGEQGKQNQGQRQPQPQEQTQEEQKTQQQKPQFSRGPGRDPDQESKLEPPSNPSGAQQQTNNFEQIQAAILLDNLREDERNWNFFPEVQMKDLQDAGEPEKDW